MIAECSHIDAKYGMRLTDIFEAPIADVRLDGSTEIAGSLRTDDIKAASNPKWQVKAERAFRSVSEMVNLTIVNATGGRLNVAGRPTKIAVDNLIEWSGCYYPSDYKETFGFLPPSYTDRLNITLVSNEGDERIPLTPWMIAHRFMHALGNTSANYPRVNTQTSYPFDRFFRKMQDALSAVRDASHFYQIKGYSTATNNKEIFAKLATFGSARNGKIERPGEFIIEIATQYFLTGNFDFDTSSFTLNASQSEEIDYSLGKAKEYLDKTFNAAKGLLIVF